MLNSQFSSEGARVAPVARCWNHCSTSDRGSDQCSIPNAQFLSEQSERFATRHPLRLRIEHWELNIGQNPIGHSAKLFLRKSLGGSSGHLAEQRAGFQPDASGSFLKCVLLVKGWLR